MSRGARLAGLLAGLCAALWLVTASASAAAPKPITGTLSARGYTVLALERNGNATAVAASRGRFKLRPLADTVTLALRAPGGKYAGPVVVGRKGSYAVLGVRAGARLGRVRINARAGYARLARSLPRRWLDTNRLARMRRGVPLGAGNYGFVRSRPIRASLAATAAARGSGGDRDADGVPNVLDIAGYGDLTLNVLRKSRRARSSQAEGCEAYDCTAGFEIGSNLYLPFQETVNVNALPQLASDQLSGLMDAALQRFLMLDLSVGAPGYEAELDCGAPQKRANPALGGLSYCTRGGTGMIVDNNRGDQAAFPDCCDPAPYDNGYGALGFAPGNFAHSATLRPGAAAADIGSGDALIARVGKGVKGNIAPGDHAATLQFVFATVPALVSYSDTAGNCAKVSGTPGSCATEFSYPVAPSTPGCPPPGCSPSGLGTQGNGFPVAAGPDGDIVVTLSFWRPQRAPIAPGETGGGDACLPSCQWVDIGGLAYVSAFGGEDGGACPRKAYSNSDLRIGSKGDEAGENPGTLSDQAPAQAADPANSFSYTVNLSECLRDPQHGEGSRGGPLSWTSGQERVITVTGEVPDTSPNVESTTTTDFVFKLL